jgi:hypothetical protein
MPQYTSSPALDRENFMHSFGMFPFGSEHYRVAPFGHRLSDRYLPKTLISTRPPTQRERSFGHRPLSSFYTAPVGRNIADRDTQFISSRGNEYFCEIDEEYLTDRFNLTGLNTEVQYYQYALDLVTDVFDFDCDDDMREQIEKSARHLYGLVHARYIVTTRGLAKMV